MHHSGLIATGVILAGLAPVTAEAAYAAYAEENESPIRLSGLIFADAVEGDGDGWKGDESLQDVRLAEFSLRYDGERFSAVAGYDFARDGEWRDVGLIARFDNGFIGFGQFKEPASLAKFGPQSGTIGLEAPRFTSAFGMGRRLGVHATLRTDAVLFQGAVTNGSLDASDASGRGAGQTALSVRASTAIEREDSVLHLGGYARWLDYDDAGVKIGAGPHSALAGKTVSTSLTAYYGREAERSTLVGGELGFSAGRWFASAEAARFSLDLPTGDEAVHGGAIQASVALTGESRSYDPKKGVFKPVKPARALGDGGFGALELTARVDHLDLSPLVDGESTSFGVGLTWTPRENVRVMARFDEERGSGAMPDSQSLGLRVQFGF